MSCWVVVAMASFNGLDIQVLGLTKINDGILRLNVVGRDEDDMGNKVNIRGEYKMMVF